MFERQMADGFVNEVCQILLMRLKRDERMHALKFGVVGGNFLMEMQLRYMVTIAGVVLYYGHRGVIARSLDGKRDQRAP